MDVGFFDSLDNDENMNLLKKMQVKDKIKIFYKSSVNLDLDKVFRSIKSVYVRDKIVYFLKKKLLI